MAGRLNSGVRPHRLSLGDSMQDSIIRSLIAFSSGAVVLPIAVFAIFRALLPVEATGYGNIGFWSTVLMGAALASAAVWIKQVPWWLAALAGPVAVLALLVPWVVWKVANAA